MPGCNTPIHYELYDAPRARAGTGLNSNSVCVIVMGILLLMVLWNAYAGSSHGSYIHAMLGRVVSARAAETPSDEDEAKGDVDDAALEDNAKEAITEVGESAGPSAVYNLTALHGGQKYNELKEEQRSKFEAKVRAFLEKHDEAIILFFAPWCGHCHAFLPKFVHVANKTEVPVAIVNAECLPRSCISGDGATLVKIPYFPFVALCTKDEDGKIKVTEVPTQDTDVIAQAADAKSTEDAVEEPAAESLDAFW